MISKETTQRWFCREANELLFISDFFDLINIHGSIKWVIFSG
jgi:hypothetical protein